MNRLLIVLFTLSTVLAGAARSDTVVFKTGATIEGKAKVQGDTLEIVVPEGSLFFSMALVAEIRAQATPLEQYETMARSVAPADIEGHYRLAVFCEANRLKAQARNELIRVVTLAPDDARARTALGFRKYQDRWMTDEEICAALGFVKVDGEWMSSRAAERYREMARRSSETEGRLTSLEDRNRKLEQDVDHVVDEGERAETEAKARIEELERKVDLLTPRSGITQTVWSPGPFLLPYRLTPCYTSRTRSVTGPTGSSQQDGSSTGTASSVGSARSTGSSGSH